MTVKCDQCQFEQKSNGDRCENCHAPLTANEQYIVCSKCGLSNDILAETCVGCKAQLDFSIKEEDNNMDRPLNKDLETKSLFFYGIFKKIKTVRKKTLFISSGILVALVFLILVAFWLFNDDYYIQPEAGFYYVSNNNELFIVDEDQDKTLLLSGVETVQSVKKFKNNIYFLADKKLYHYKKKKAELLAEDVDSFKVNLDGNEILYTVLLENTGYGDLYFYDGKSQLRIDGNVGHERYVFSEEKDGVFYVKDITEEESLGTLYYKVEDSPAEIVAEDVYEPVVSLDDQTVYFVRKNRDEVSKFELYYYNGKQIIEIDRHVKHMLLNPKEEMVYLIQDKNDVLSLLSTEEGEVKSLVNDIKAYGQYAYGDIVQPLVYLEPFFIICSQSEQTHLYFNKKDKITIHQNMDNYMLSQDHKVLYTVFDGDIDVFDFEEGVLKDAYNIGSQAELLEISSEGKYGVIKKHTGEIVLSDRGKETDSPKDGHQYSFSDNEKYVMYQSKGDVYVHKITAKEPIYLSELAEVYFMIEDKVYYFENDKIFSYKLGRFKSKKQIDTYKTWSNLK